VNDEYGILLAAPPGYEGMTVYLEATDDEDAMQQVSSRWAPDDVTAVFHYPRGRQAGTQRKVWPLLTA